MLFGAGMLLFISRLEDKTGGLMPAEYYFRRQLWLLLFGLFNAYILLWFWDILYHYAIFGMMLFAFRRLKPKQLLVAAGICLLLQTARENVDFYRDKQMISRGEAIAKLDTTTTKLTPLQKERLDEYQGFVGRVKPEARKKRIEKNIRDVQGSYASLYRNHSNASLEGETAGVFYFLFFDVLVFMFIGMAFYKSGVLTGTAKTSIYWWLFGIGLGLGLVLSWFRVHDTLDNGFNRLAYTKNVAFEYYEISRTLRGLGIFGGIMLLYKWGAFRWFFSLMRPVGQMAFTNYLAQSFICGLIFYGVGFGLFGKLQIYEIYYVVAAVWVVEIIWSHIWLRYFRFGPMEWLWRSATYWKWQKLRKSDPAKAVSTQSYPEHTPV